MKRMSSKGSREEENGALEKESRSRSMSSERMDEECKQFVKDYEEVIIDEVTRTVVRNFMQEFDKAKVEERKKFSTTN